MMMLDTLRTLIGIRQQRQTLPPGIKPALGSSIVRGQLRIRLKYAITNEQWAWLTAMGWRTVNMRQNRRHYINVADPIVHQLVTTEYYDEREVIHQAILDAAAARTGSTTNHPLPTR